MSLCSVFLFAVHCSFSFYCYFLYWYLSNVFLWCSFSICICVCAVFVFLLYMYLCCICICTCTVLVFVVQQGRSKVFEWDSGVLSWPPVTLSSTLTASRSLHREIFIHFPTGSGSRAGGQLWENQANEGISKYLLTHKYHVLHSIFKGRED